MSEVKSDFVFPVELRDKEFYSICSFVSFKSGLILKSGFKLGIYGKTESDPVEGLVICFDSGEHVPCGMLPGLYFKSFFSSVYPFR